MILLPFSSRDSQWAVADTCHDKKNVALLLTLGNFPENRLFCFSYIINGGPMIVFQLSRQSRTCLFFRLGTVSLLLFASHGP